MNKVQKSLISVCIIVFVVLSVLYFAIPFPKNAASWVAYVASVISVVFGYFTANIAFKGTESLKSKVYGFPVFRIGYIYLIAQVIFTILICLINIVFLVPAWISIVISVIFLAIALIGVIGADNARDVIENIDEQTEIKTKKVTYFNLDISNVLDVCKDNELKKKINILSEKFRYSDPVSCDELVDIENKISDEIDKLKDIVIENNKESAIEKIDYITNLLADRNRKCKALKK